jgi:hypothetical protein
MPMALALAFWARLCKTRAIPLLELVLPPVGVFLAVSEHGVDQAELDRVSHEIPEN